MKQETSAKDQAKDITVGLVDNHPTFTGPLAAMLNQQPRTQVIWCAENGLIMQEKIVLAGLPKMILMDIEMPEMNGYRSVQWLSKQYPLVQVLVLTNFANAEVHARLEVYKVGGFLSKVVGHEEVYHAIVQLDDQGFYQNRQQFFKRLGYDERWALQHSTERMDANRERFLALCATDYSQQEIAEQMHMAIRRCRTILPISLRNLTSIPGMPWWPKPSGRG